ncbi:hypothetical protein NGA_0490600, partial [Nannochloropsis gaditana CCMP526]
MRHVRRWWWLRWE